MRRIDVTEAEFQELSSKLLAQPIPVWALEAPPRPLTTVEIDTGALATISAFFNAYVHRRRPYV